MPDLIDVDPLVDPYMPRLCMHGERTRNTRAILVVLLVLVALRCMDFDAGLLCSSGLTYRTKEASHRERIRHHGSQGKRSDHDLRSLNLWEAVSRGRSRGRSRQLKEKYQILKKLFFFFQKAINSNVGFLERPTLE